jgi:hypothetical protein
LGVWQVSVVAEVLTVVVDEVFLFVLVMDVEELSEV